MKIKLKSSYKFYILVLVIVIIIFTKLWINYNYSNPSSNYNPHVTTQTIIPHDVELASDYSGRVTSFKYAEIKPQINGIIIEQVYKEGQYVHKGDILFKLEKESLEAASMKAKSRLQQTEHNYQRIKKLFHEKTVSSREYEEALANFQQAEADARTASINLEYTNVTAPINGIAGKAEYTEGNLVLANSTLLTKVVQLDPCYVEFGYSDQDFLTNYLKKISSSGQINDLKIALKLDNDELYEHEGSFHFNDSVIDEQTSTIKATAIVPNPANKITPGQFAKVIIKGIKINGAIIIPDQAVMQGSQGTFVYTVNNDNKIIIKPVKLGSLIEQGRMIEHGLESGDRIVTEGMIKIYPQQVVIVDTENNQTDQTKEQ
ncbi:efflux RND transporter periplasmic adaptor subunit [Rickettsiales endosymbiont of Stachyamoeba lipophora]|uniref:efflux RND transporter periplasmic adaptor subunit n=1 Tax=Rickettsiales endosymbiont of Stachyamoeba lipophora TaxID=2486578 RepID=UPI000F64E629|nr:efflux RND transporter periplasmic adaptor subunit [Rickettsiales endosymbiont of Stachyamoeba lipophora]AZL16070.1 efflux RND transporter periplasmic adaptor subunit [Rickettsiales endosymbiont of Stachyamoeba lipophora]